MCSSHATKFSTIRVVIDETNTGKIWLRFFRAQVIFTSRWVSKATVSTKFSDISQYPDIRACFVQPTALIGGRIASVRVVFDDTMCSEHFAAHQSRVDDDEDGFILSL